MHRHQPNSQLQSLVLFNLRKQLPGLKPGQAVARAGGGHRGARGWRGELPAALHHHNANMEGNTQAAASPGARLGGRSPPAAASGPGPTCNFWGPSSRGQREARPGGDRCAAGSAAPPLAPGGRSGYFPAGQLRHFGETLRAETGGRSPSSPAPPGPGALKLQSGGGGGPGCPPRPAPPARGSPAGPRGAEPRGRRREEGGGKGRVVAGAGRAGPAHKGRSRRRHAGTHRRRPHLADAGLLGDGPDLVDEGEGVGELLPAGLEDGALGRGQELGHSPGRGPLAAALRTILNSRWPPSAAENGTCASAGRGEGGQGAREKKSPPQPGRGRGRRPPRPVTRLCDGAVGAGAHGGPGATGAARGQRSPACSVTAEGEGGCGEEPFAVAPAEGRSAGLVSAEPLRPRAALRRALRGRARR